MSIWACLHIYRPTAVALFYFFFNFFFSKHLKFVFHCLITSDQGGTFNRAGNRPIITKKLMKMIGNLF